MADNTIADHVLKDLQRKVDQGYPVSVEDLGEFKMFNEDDCLFELTYEKLGWENEDDVPETQDLYDMFLHFATTNGVASLKLRPIERQSRPLNPKWKGLYDTIAPLFLNMALWPGPQFCLTMITGDGDILYLRRYPDGSILPNMPSDPGWSGHDVFDQCVEEKLDRVFYLYVGWESGA